DVVLRVSIPVAAVGVGSVYLLLVRLLLDGPRRRLDPLTAGFLFAAPASAGFLTAVFAGAMPAPFAALGRAALLPASRTHRSLSVLLALPVFVSMALLGGLAAECVAGSWYVPAIVAAVVVPPTLTAWECRFPRCTAVRHMRTSTLIDANPQTVWERI